MIIEDIEMNEETFEIEYTMFEDDKPEEYCTALATQMFKAVVGDIPFEDVHERIKGEEKELHITDMECDSSYSGYPEVKLEFKYHGSKSEEYYRNVILKVFGLLVGHNYSDATNES